MIEYLDKKGGTETQLGSQYISTVEIGGAYAHLFFRLLDFLELRALIVTDLDSGKIVNDRIKACKVSEGIRTTNGCLLTGLTIRRYLRSISLRRPRKIRLALTAA